MGIQCAMWLLYTLYTLETRLTACLIPESHGDCLHTLSFYYPPLPPQTLFQTDLRRCTKVGKMLTFFWFKGNIHTYRYGKWCLDPDPQHWLLLDHHFHYSDSLLCLVNQGLGLFLKKRKTRFGVWFHIVLGAFLWWSFWCICAESNKQQGFEWQTRN